jgi:endonuclease/exonuclease/phosphatase family metal-dependent hydrolase
VDADAGDGGVDAGGGEGEDGGPGPASWCSTQWPPETATAARFPTEALYARVWVDGVTPTGGASERLDVELGLGAGDPEDPGAGWSWARAVFNAACADCGNDDEWMGTLAPDGDASELYWAARIRVDDGAWKTCDRSDDGRQGSDDGWSAADAPVLRVSEPDGLRVVGLNLRCLVDDWDARLPIVAASLAAEDPDAVLLQEVCAGEGRDNLAELAEELGARTGLAWASERTITHRGWDVYDEGLAVLTPHRIAAARAVDLPAGIFPRKVLLARVVGPQGPVVVASTHLEYEDAAIREDQAQAAVDAAAGFAAGTEAVVLGGDWNEAPGGAVHAALAAGGFEDLWAVLRAADDGFTFPADDPGARIDALWLRAGASGFAPFTIETILAGAVDGTHGSDHLGLSAWITR